MSCIVKFMNLIGLILGIVFIVLQLTGAVHWSWVWVLSPFWIMAAELVVLFLLPIDLK